MPRTFDRDAHRHDGDDGNRKGKGHGHTAPEQTGKQEHPAQGNEIDLGEVDDADGVVHHTKPQRDQGVDGAVGNPRENKLHQILKTGHPRSPIRFSVK